MSYILNYKTWQSINEDTSVALDDRVKSLINLPDFKEVSKLKPKLKILDDQQRTEIAKDFGATPAELISWADNKISDVDFVKNMLLKKYLQTSPDLKNVELGKLLLTLGSKGAAVKEIQKKLKEKGFLDKEPTGEFDNDTYSAVKSAQKASKIVVDGIVGPQTYKVLYAVTPESAVTSGEIKSSYTGDKAKNIDLLIKTMEEKGITNPYSKIGLLSTIGKESQFIPQSENLDYSKERLPEVWRVFSKTGQRVPNGQGASNYNDLAVEYEHNPEKLANFVYGQKPYGMRSNAFGNTQPGDGWKYRGRGFNQLTFKENYERYASQTGLDLVSNPDLLNNPNIAAKAAVDFLVNGVKDMGTNPNEFTSVDQAITSFVTVNAGGNLQSAQIGIASANHIKPNFSIEPVTTA